MNDCFFCGPNRQSAHRRTRLASLGVGTPRGKFGSDHFIHVRSTGDSTTGLWKSPNLKITTKSLCDKCNNVWLGTFDDKVIKPIATSLIVGDNSFIKPADQWNLAAWAYKMALLLEIAMPPEERHSEFYTAAERRQFRDTTLPNEHVRVFLAQYKYGQHPTHAHQHLHTLTRRDDQFSFQLKICTITAGCLGMQVIATRAVTTGELVYASSEMEIELLGRAKEAIVPIWPLTSLGVHWPPPSTMAQEDIEEWTMMWQKAEGLTPLPQP